MIKHKDHFHGSDLEKIEEIYGIKKEEIVSFSANVNPLGVSPLLKHTLSDQIDLPFYSGRASEKGPCHWSYLL